MENTSAETFGSLVEYDVFNIRKGDWPLIVRMCPIYIFSVLTSNFLAYRLRELREFWIRGGSGGFVTAFVVYTKSVPISVRVLSKINTVSRNTGHRK
jgi:hypothetical protein